MNSTWSGEQRDLVEAVVETLQQGEALLTEISDETYTQKIPVAFNACIGGHYRHCLDHFRSVLNASTGNLDYDRRERGTAIETDRYAALNATRALLGECERLEISSLRRPVLVSSKTNYGSTDSQTAPSTLGREIMYAVAHAIHHYALIGIMCGIQGLKVPAGFGVAPSTLKHQAGTAA